MTDTHEVINAYCRYIATLSDLLGLATGCGRWDVHAKYAALRRDMTGALHGVVDAGLDDGMLSLDEAARALAPVASLETASVF